MAHNRIEARQFKLSSDPLFLEKTRDIVALYLSPPGEALVLRADKKCQMQALERTLPKLTAKQRIATAREDRLTRQE